MKGHRHNVKTQTLYIYSLGREKNHCSQSV